jgi:hypothetical protein
MFSMVSTLRESKDGGEEGKSRRVPEHRPGEFGESKISFGAPEEDVAQPAETDPTEGLALPASRLQYRSTFNNEWMWLSEVKYSRVRTCL